jgi:hypothetical protein
MWSPFFAGNAFEFKETHPFVRDTLKGWIHEIRWAWKEYYRIGLIEDIRHLIFGDFTSIL